MYPLKNLIHLIALLEIVWKSFPEFAGVVKPCTTEALKELLLLWTITALWICLAPWSLLMTSLEALCIGFLSFPLSLIADLVSYSVHLLILLETPKSMSDPILTSEYWLKTLISEAEIPTYPEELVVPLEKLPSRAYRLDISGHCYVKVSSVSFFFIVR